MSGFLFSQKVLFHFGFLLWAQLYVNRAKDDFPPVSPVICESSQRWLSRSISHILGKSCWGPENWGRHSTSIQSRSNLGFYVSSGLIYLSVFSEYLRAITVSVGFSLIYFYLFLIEEMHAEICYAECLLQKAALTFVQVTNIWLSISVTREAC